MYILFPRKLSLVFSPAIDLFYTFIRNSGSISQIVRIIKCLKINLIFILALFFFFRQILSRRIGEDLLILCKRRLGHSCDFSYIVVGIVLWDGLDRETANKVYDVISYKVGNFGLQTVSEFLTMIRLSKVIKSSTVFWRFVKIDSFVHPG